MQRQIEKMGWERGFESQSKVHVNFQPTSFWQSLSVTDRRHALKCLLGMKEDTMDTPPT